MTVLRRLAAPALAAVALVTFPPAGHAQGSIGASFGPLLPVGGALIKEFGGINGAIVPYPVFERWHTGALVASIRFTQRLSPRIGIEGKYSHSPGRIATRDSTNAVTERAGFMGILSIRAPFRITSPSSGILLQFAPGIAVSKRGGRAWSGYGGTVDPQAVMSVAFGGTLGRRSKWSSRIEIENYFSMTRFDSPLYSVTERRPHHDFVITFGFDYSFSRPRLVR